ncbi:MAG: protoheme IX farnesyltransferase [Bacteroidetes bacterium]|nr:protoheme IX farnesyltransferase [Bacteroidota bacterium]
MSITKVENISSIPFFEKTKCYSALFKLKITVFVVISAIFGYFIGASEFSVLAVLSLTIGGFFITSAANAFNQIIERNYDLLMDRTKNRPLPQNKVSVSETLIIAFTLGILGVLILGIFLNPLSGILGLLAIFMYAAVYTPLKRVSTFGVFIGAFPGAFPPMLGYVAATGSFGLEAGILFFIQFVWQFPHFWAIAWRLHKDYNKAGFKMLPYNTKNRTSAIIILLSSLTLFASSFLPEFFGLTGRIATIGLFILSFLMVIPSIKLVQTQDDKFALRIMLLSYLYLIFSLFFILIDKV